MSSKVTGWTQLIMAGLAAFLQIWSATHGVAADPAHLAVTAAVAANGIHHVSGKVV